MQHNNDKSNPVRIRLNHLFADFVIRISYKRLFNWLIKKFNPQLKTLLKSVCFLNILPC
ncbi:hypothetical protein O185_26600 [Photorhabdus temperata J3]|uniref:Uncharacterized protein n=1 Tax=Photorhabdus temperata J3 TaxID=1389415 RepID=U7QQE4_PHOTE|nr:hypothetical protein O185_26600 [Photorhabdus temperata J3]